MNRAELTARVAGETSLPKAAAERLVGAVFSRHHRRACCRRTGEHRWVRQVRRQEPPGATGTKPPDRGARRHSRHPSAMVQSGQDLARCRQPEIRVKTRRATASTSAQTPRGRSTDGCAPDCDAQAHPDVGAMTLPNRYPLVSASGRRSGPSAPPHTPRSSDPPRPPLRFSPSRRTFVAGMRRTESHPFTKRVNM